MKKSTIVVLGVVVGVIILIGKIGSYPVDPPVETTYIDTNSQEYITKNHASETTKRPETTKVETTKVETTRTPETTLNAEEQAELDYNNWFNTQFSWWDGSCIPLVDLVKEYMNDPKSFEHKETRYTDNGDHTVTLYMSYRGNNAFGALVLNEVWAIMDYNTMKISITSNG